MADKRDLMDELEEDMTKAQQSNLPPFFFSLKDGEKALIHALVPEPVYLKLPFHEKYNVAQGKFEVSAVCAMAYGQECQYCNEAKEQNDRKLSTQNHYYLPIYVHRVNRLQADKKTWQPVTYKDEEGVERPVGGLRVLDVKPSSSILIGLKAAYYEDEQRNLTNYDFVIERRGSGRETEYTVTLKPGSPAVLPSDLVVPTEERMKSDIELARPMKAVAESAPF